MRKDRKTFEMRETLLFDFYLSILSNVHHTVRAIALFKATLLLRTEGLLSPHLGTFLLSPFVP